MTAKGHIFFTLSSSILIQHFIFSKIMHHDDWWCFIPISLITCLLPDIDHPKSIIGNKFKYISYLCAKIFCHRGFTHSIGAIYSIILIIKIISTNITLLIIPIKLGIIIGYCSHICADMLTPSGVLLLWPLKQRFRIPIIKKKLFTENFFCYIYFICSLYLLYPHNNHHIIHFMINFLSKR
ncbi:metal-dependent hydrolase [Enterobacteriaceae endosymbiont of Macroplea mutica]|uniref:metal-dependent hydrolase n=1 Tax=Enterobacteriaceae endosymbiont of Macroplea mutica TaxID=2675791 RepID=UPI001448A480|nr:metal-dependent hydrolase [Enterobacteriaceae endosymbiont of Macroplea mutica]QJC31068.1 metal-dependent hydrolase [Enterobacteriaceae endosymbiont of Macroplea mutica]